jgi:5-carboxymethyl-2-hydroxymuconate isomerase
MPTLTLEYTPNLSFDKQHTLTELNRTLIDSKQFFEADIKSRAVCMSDYVIGLSDEPRAFVIIKLGLLSGRSMETRDAIADALLIRIQTLIPAPSHVHTQYCIDLVEHERERYQKAVVSVDH